MSCQFFCTKLDLYRNNRVHFIDSTFILADNATNITYVFLIDLLSISNVLLDLETMILNETMGNYFLLCGQVKYSALSFYGNVTACKSAQELNYMEPLIISTAISNAVEPGFRFFINNELDNIHIDICAIFFQIQSNEVRFMHDFFQ